MTIYPFVAIAFHRILPQRATTTVCVCVCAMCVQSLTTDTSSFTYASINRNSIIPTAVFLLPSSIYFVSLVCCVTCDDEVVSLIKAAQKQHVRLFCPNSRLLLFIVTIDTKSLVCQNCVPEQSINSSSSYDMMVLLMMTDGVYFIVFVSAKKCRKSRPECVLCAA